MVIIQCILNIFCNLPNWQSKKYCYLNSILFPCTTNSHSQPNIDTHASDYCQDDIAILFRQQLVKLGMYWHFELRLSVWKLKENNSKINSKPERSFYNFGAYEGQSISLENCYKSSSQPEAIGTFMAYSISNAHTWTFSDFGDMYALVKAPSQHQFFLYPSYV